MKELWQIPPETSLIWRFSLYLIKSTLLFHYKEQSDNAVLAANRRVLW